jgi:hypothetical protein
MRNPVMVVSHFPVLETAELIARIAEQEQQTLETQRAQLRMMDNGVEPVRISLYRTLFLRLVFSRLSSVRRAGPGIQRARSQRVLPAAQSTQRQCASSEISRGQC